jgi:hypothetical protein
MITLVLLHTGVGVWGMQEGEYGYWLLKVKNAALAGGFLSNPILSGPESMTLARQDCTSTHMLASGEAEGLPSLAAPAHCW